MIHFYVQFFCGQIPQYSYQIVKLCRFSSLYSRTHDKNAFKYTQTKNNSIQASQDIPKRKFRHVLSSDFITVKMSVNHCRKGQIVNV